jgi:hypothetical protein
MFPNMCELMKLKHDLNMLQKYRQIFPNNALCLGKRVAELKTLLAENCASNDVHSFNTAKSVLVQGYLSSHNFVEARVCNS